MTGGNILVILKAKDISKIYGDLNDESSTIALQDINISINAGEFIAIMGPSGSGKTTLLNIMSGLDQPTSGAVSIEGKQLSQFKGEKLAQFRRRQIGFVFQDFNLLDSLTVKENIMLPMILEKKQVDEMEDKVYNLANLFEINSLLNKYPSKISGGQQQRTAVSRALVNEPSIILADEPTGNLDSKSSAVIMELFEKIVETLSTTVLIVTHDIFAASYCNKVIFIKDGSIDSTITREGNKKEFLQQIMANVAVLGGRTDVF